MKRAGYIYIPAILPAFFAAACSSTPPPVKRPVEAPAPHTTENTAASDKNGNVGQSADAKEDRLIARMLKKVSQVRSLEAKAPVPGKVLERSELIARVRGHIDKEVPKTAIVNEGLVLQLFGFVPTKFDYEAEMYKLLEAQLAGYYEPGDKTMYMASDLDEDSAKATLAHELVHSLQDQYWDLKSKSKYLPGEDDTSEARSSLAEGDATSAMMDVLLMGSGKTALDLPADLFTEQMLTSMSSGETANEPHAMVASLVAPYVYGTRFINQLRTEGGWAAVDKVWNDTNPLTTEQILHVDKWKAHEPAVKVADPTIAALGADWKTVDSDTGGELGTRLTFGEWMPEKEAGVVAENWAGDRQVIAQNGNKSAIAWRLRYDAAKGADDAYAKAALTKIEAALETKLGKAAVKAKDGFMCFERADRGPLAVTRKNRDLIWVLGPVTTDPSGAWKSAGDCTLAKKWVTELAAQK
ncbi:MAG: hypothetical protein ABI461_20555 [Polyangiaceae bacterium]